MHIAAHHIDTYVIQSHTAENSYQGVTRNSRRDLSMKGGRVIDCHKIATGRQREQYFSTSQANVILALQAILSGGRDTKAK